MKNTNARIMESLAKSMSLRGAVNWLNAKQNNQKLTNAEMMKAGKGGGLLKGLKDAKQG